MLITQADVVRFAEWSGDRNPIHVDSDVANKSAFGGTIVHGALSTITALRQTKLREPNQVVSKMEIEFRGEIRPEHDYLVEEGPSADQLTVAVRTGDQLQMSVRVGTSLLSPTATPGDSEPWWSWVGKAKRDGTLSSGADEPVDWQSKDFRSGQQVSGVHQFGEHSAHPDGWLTTIQEKVLGLCSFMVGMKAPGLSSLFTRLNLKFSQVQSDTDRLVYRLTFDNYDRHFRLLETNLEVATLDGLPVANAEIQSYVRFPQREPDPVSYQKEWIAKPQLASKKQLLSKKVALVCGGSRGLGAEMAAALGSAGCKVYIACRHPNQATESLAENIRGTGGEFWIVAGDIGDHTWCKTTREKILSDHGRLDLLILNACAPPIPAPLGGGDPSQSSAYLQTNLALVQNPLRGFLPLISQTDGAVVGISSSFVEEIPAGFADYVAVKMAMEAAIQIAAKENPSTRFVIARPPKLQTSWNDTPTGAMGAISPRAAAAQIVHRLVSPIDDSNLLLVNSFEDQEPAVESTAIEPDLQLVLCASFTLDPIVEGFQKWSDELGVEIEPQFAPYAQILQQALDPSSVLSRSSSGSVILLRVSDWLRELPADRLANPERLKEWMERVADEHVRAITSHRGFAAGPTLMLICPSTLSEKLPADVVQAIESNLIAELSSIRGLHIREAEHFHDLYEVDESLIYDSLREDIAHIPFHNSYYHFLCTLTVRFFHRQLMTPKKVIVLDCDNTLWKGVVGEAGPDGIQFEAVHVRLHERLMQLSDVGILLCLCSKNEENDVWSVFEQRKGFGIRREQIVASAINWMPKSQNIHSLAKRLNLGLDSFIFLDDNPIECAEVREGCPSVLTVQWPQDSGEAERLLEHFWELDVHTTTTEDRKRTQLYREESQRQQSRNQASDFQQFIDSLELEIQLEKLTEADLPRASQLTLRTNQFNFTTIRRSEAELASLMEDSEHECRVVRVRDRFGDYGLVGFFIAMVQGDELSVDTFLLSCRVLGRGVEHEMAAEIGRLAVARELSEVTWRHIPTERNTPARLFLKKVAPESVSDDDAETVEARVASEQLAKLSWRADDPEEETATTKTSQPNVSSAETISSVRARELQIERAANSLATLRQLSTAFDGADSSSRFSEGDLSDVAEVVAETFAKALRLSVAEVQQIDRLEAMGCDSLRIVEITVALTKQYSWLPKTLLFEHRTVSEIIDRIVDLASEGPSAGNETTKTMVAAEAVQVQDIAIVGMGIRCSGGNSPGELWEFLSQGKSGVSKVPSSRDSFVGTLQDTREHFAGLLDDAADFDPEFFRISPREAEYMDPQLRLLLQTGWHALEDAGSQGEELDRETGIFVGVMYADYGRFANAIAKQTGSVYRCWENFSLANRLSQVLGCDGPSLSIDTACSSSATALHYACRSLRNGDCSTALVSGVNLIVDPDRLVQFGKLGILSESGRCVPFGSGADGTVMGEGVVSLVLRPLDVAQQRGDQIYATIKGTGISAGAGSVGFTAPNPNAQSIATRRAILAAGVDPRTISYIETHGTGTELGDPIEVRGLEMAYCDRQLQQPSIQVEHHCGIGSIKPNVGHLEAGAGLMGIAKVALQLKHGILVPSLTSDAPNPQIPFDDLPFFVQTSFTPWKRPSARVNGNSEELPRRAGVNSFGVGGSNVHVILEESAEATLSTEKRHSTERSSHLLALSAPTPSALSRQLDAWRKFLPVQSQQAVANACFSANAGRRHHAYRAAVVLRGAGDVSERLEQTARVTHDHRNDQKAASAIRTAFLFTGQGAQYPTMLSELYRESPVFREAFDHCASVLDDSLPRSLHEVVLQGEVGDLEHAIHQTGFTQPALFAVQYSLHKLWSSWGIAADVMMGHSIGEVAAYCASGGCSVEDGLKLVAARGRLMQALPSGGTMCSTSLDFRGAEEMIAKLGDHVSIAAINGPHQTVISGIESEVTKIAQQLESQGVKATLLSVSHAFHSALMEPMLKEFADIVGDLELRAPQGSVVSSATGKVVTGEMATVDYWVDQVRRPVRFHEAMLTLSEQRVTHFVELGPHPVLLAMGRQCLPEAEARWMPSARRQQSDWTTILESLGQLYVDGSDVDWNALDAPYRRRRISVPGYHFEAHRTWIDALNSYQDDILSKVSRPHDGDGPCAYDLRWIEKSRANNQPSTNTGSWLILSDIAQVASNFRKQLERRGVSCASGCLAFSGSVCPSTGDPRVPCHTSMDELEARLVDGDFSRIIWVDSSQTDAPNASVIQETATRKVFHLSQLVTAVAKTSPAMERAVWVITACAVAASKEMPGAISPASISSAPLWGFARVATLEHDRLWGGIIDVDSIDDTIDSLIAELQSADDDDQVAFRAQSRLVPRLQTCETSAREAVSSGQSLKEVTVGGTVLITGGLGGVGLQAATWLVDQGIKHLVLSSRSGQPSLTAQEQIATLTDRGAEIHVVAADVATAEGVQVCLDACQGGLPVGVIHAAGIDLREPILGTSLKQTHDLLAAKVQGAWRLHQACQSTEVRWFVCVSSIAALLGSTDRSLYAAANSFLDALAHHRRGLGLPALSLNFGPWLGGGMADEKSLAELQRIGNHGLPPGETLNLIGDLLQRDLTQALVADVRWNQFRPVFESRRSKPILGDLGSACWAKTDHRGSEATNGGLAWERKLCGLNEEERLKKLATLLREEVAKLLRIQDADSIGSDRNLFELGMDSLTSAELSSNLRRLAGVVDVSLITSVPTISGLAKQLVEQISGSHGEGESTDRSPQGSDWLGEVSAASPPERVERLSELLVSELSASLGKQNTSVLSVTTPVVNLGLDSLGSVEFANRIRRRLNLPQAPKILEYETLGALAAHLETGLPQQASSQIIGYDGAIEPDVFEFCQQAWPKRRADWIRPRWRWMFVDSAKRVETKPTVWLYQDEGKIVGHHGAQFVRLKVGDVTRTTAWLVDTMVATSHRDRAVGTQLVMQSLEDMPLNLSLGQTQQMRAILEKIGWQRVGPLNTYLYPINAQRVLKDKLPGTVTPMASAWIHLRNITRQLMQTSLDKQVQTRTVEIFDARHDDLWKRVSIDYPCAVVRDASYMNWKYVDQPGQSFVRLEVENGGDLLGTAVIAITESDDTYSYRRAFITELVTSTRTCSLQTMLHAILLHSKALKADAVVMHVINPSIERMLINFGFMKRPSTRHLVVAVDETVDTQRILDPTQWLVTQGDSDIDRPW